MTGLPADLATYYQSSKTPMYVYGHSLGAAILGDAIFGTTILSQLFGSPVGPFDAIIINAGLDFITFAPQKTIVAPVFFDILGLNDGLDNRNAHSIPNFQQATGINQLVGKNLYQQPGTQHFFLEIPDMSHFCVLADLNMDEVTLLNTVNDGPAPKIKSCEQELFAALANQGFL